MIRIQQPQTILSTTRGGILVAVIYLQKWGPTPYFPFHLWGLTPKSSYWVVVWGVLFVAAPGGPPNALWCSLKFEQKIMPLGHKINGQPLICGTTRILNWHCMQISNSSMGIDNVVVKSRVSDRLRNTLLVKSWLVKTRRHSMITTYTWHNTSQLIVNCHQVYRLLGQCSLINRRNQHKHGISANVKSRSERKCYEFPVLRQNLQHLSNPFKLFIWHSIGICTQNNISSNVWFCHSNNVSYSKMITNSQLLLLIFSLIRHLVTI